MAMLHSTTRNARLDFRLSRKHKRIIEQAATATGQSLSDFAVAHLVQAAQRAIDEATVTRLSNRDRDAFLKLLDSNTKPNKALRAAAARYGKRRQSLRARHPDNSASES
ncbi:MAG: type II toxin-antitoxin system TacA family antitoxin [Phycisphaerales bacterium]